jgi:LCP family protein required for cell wall assembly
MNNFTKNTIHRTLAKESTGGERGKMKWYQKRTGRVLIIIGILLVAIGIGFAIKTGFILNKVTGGNANIFSSLMRSLPGVGNELEGEKEGRINILLLGMRGSEDPNGGTLADTIMVISIHPKSEENDTPKASMISIPRDLYVTVPGTSEQRKINAVHALGEEGGKGDGMTAMRKAVEEVSGLTIPYAVTINFQGFKDLVNALDGVEVTLEEPFTEAVQFQEPKVCDPYVFTVPTSPIQYENKYYTRKNGTRYIAKSYPLCYNKNVECGGEFSLPAGANKLDGDKALCYARARYQTNDFERAKRQQQVIEAIKKKALSAGTVSDFGRINGLLETLGNNVATNLQGWEMKRFYDLYKETGDVEPKTFVLDTTNDGLLYAPEVTKEAGYILLPVGDNYDKIKALFAGSLQ